jgi:hypothetical protein
VSRRCRELVKEGKLEVAYEQVSGKGPRCVMYKIKIPTNGTDLRKHYQEMGKIKVEIVEVDGVRIARETII